MKRIMVDMSATLIHHGHIRLLEKAKKLGYVVVALTTDSEIKRHKGYDPELSFENRKEILLAIKYVDDVIPSAWLIDQEFLNKHQIDYLVHGDDNSNCINKDQLILIPRTLNISSSILRNRVLVTLQQKNK